MPKVSSKENKNIYFQRREELGLTRDKAIEFAQYDEIVSEIGTMGLADVESQGIYTKAEENLKKVINGFLSEFVDYEIVYM